MNESLFILIEENITFDLNWIYCRRKIITFNQFLKNYAVLIYNKLSKTNPEKELIIYRGE